MVVANVWVCGSRGGGDGVDGRREQSVGSRRKNWNLLGVVLSTKYNPHLTTSRQAASYVGPSLDRSCIFCAADCRA